MRLRGVRAEPGELLGAGVFSQVRALGEADVIKVARSYGLFGQPLSWQERNRREHVLAAPYVPMPPTYHVRLRDRRGNAVSAILQQRLEGKLLSEVPLADLATPSAASVREMERSLATCRRNLRWLPDVIGGPPRWGQHDVRNSNNYLVDAEGRIWLIDAPAIFLWFSTGNWLGRLYTALLVRSARRLREDVESERGIVLLRGGDGVL